MSTIDLAHLPEFLRTRRWFGGKGLPIKSVNIIEQARLGKDGQYTLGVLEVSYELGHPERYLAALTTNGSGAPREALEDDELALLLMDLIRNQGEVEAGSGKLRGEYLDDGGPLKALSKTPTVRRISAEQSNTSIVFDERVIMKIIRKLDLGYNPEWEVGQFLRKRGYKNTPPLLGGIVMEAGVHSTIAVAHEFVPVDSDGWAWMLERMEKVPLEAELVKEVRKLGECLGELHAVLASEADDPAFAPEPIQQEDLERWAASIIGELGVTTAAAMEQVPELGKRHDQLVERINRLAQVQPSGLKIRHHGDLHLGQTLRSRGEWLIFDFEGEPARNYAQRREKHSPLRDVAGMLRSFAYACATLELKGAKDGERIGPVRKAFLEGYRAAARAPGLLPADDETFRVLLETLELEKLLYELRYEVNHRPDWVGIPARTLLADLS